MGLRRHHNVFGNISDLLMFLISLIFGSCNLVSLFDCAYSYVLMSTISLIFRVCAWFYGLIVHNPYCPNLI